MQLVQPFEALGFVIRTDKIDISAYGSINVGTENIDLKFKNSPRKGIGLSATRLVKPYIEVGASLAKPGLTLDAISNTVRSKSARSEQGQSEGDGDSVLDKVD